MTHRYRSPSRHFHVVLISLLLLSVTIVSSFAQTHTATVSGKVRDRSGAFLQAAEIEFVNESTQIPYSSRTDRTGTFAISALPPGSYRATAFLVGFKKYEATGISLKVGDKVSLNLLLEVGRQEESMTVKGETPLLQSETGAVGQVIDNQMMTRLPLNQREYLQLALLGSGTAPPAAESRLSTQGNSGINVNGAREASNNFLLDGVDNNDLFLNRFVVNPSPEAIEEFKLQSSSYDAEYGRSSGAQVNVALKSGTNKIHGAAFEFLRNASLDAKNFFDRPDQKIPQYQRNQYGGSVGGPLIQSKTFYFLNYEEARANRAETRTSQVPTAAMKHGDFSETDIILKNPYTGEGFPGNRIPVEMVDPAGRQLAALFPNPNSSGVGQNFVASPRAREQMDQFNAKLDHLFNPNNKFFVRYDFINTNETLPYAQKGPNLPGFGIQVLDRGQNLAIGDTQVLSPLTINDFRFGYNRLRREVFPENVGRNVFTELGSPWLSLPERDFGYPSLILAGYEKLGDDPNIPVVRRTGTFHFSDSCSHQREKHFFKFGGEIRYYQENGYNDLFARGQLNFQPLFTGDALADLLLGFPFLTISAVNENPQALRTTAYNLFFQDDLKVNSRLSMNLGLRYEYNVSPVDALNHLMVFDLGSLQLKPVGQDDVPRSGVDPNFNNLAPRFGLSWDVTGSGKTLLRSGYGIYFDSGTLIENEALYFNPPSFRLSLFFNQPETPLNLTSPFPSGQAYQSPPSPVTLNRHFPNAYAQHWSLGIQRELRKNWMIEANYVGSKGTSLVMKRNLNQPTPGAGEINLRRPIPGFSDILQISADAFSSYHSLQVRTEKRYEKGLSLLAAYTYSKSLDNSSSFLESKGDDNTPQNSSNLAAERGLSNFDLRHRFSGNFVYDLPFGSAQHFRVPGGTWVRAVLDHWQISGIVTFQSGQPFTPRLGTDNSNTGNVGGYFAHDRPDVIGNARVENPTPERFFNVMAFAVPQRYTFKNAGRNILTGPGFSNVNLALLKDIPFTGDRVLQFRAEFFNFLNHPNFLLPESFVDNPATFGRILAAAPARQIQFGLKYIF